MILQDNGGIVLNSLTALTENLTWLEDIGNNWHCNFGNPGVKPEVFAFYKESYVG
jgi:hypothetical protein